jgi:1-aminocyclopropane-1-carboxylate deaminase/D-cysteine desulfhydrase-like pyridoxal-dependent ACC family enzyme
MRVVKALDIFERVRVCIVTRAIDLSADALGLHRREEALDGSVERTCVFADDGYVGAGYGVPTQGMIEAVTLLARTVGLLLDPVYSG